jgi:hypothetical protein
MRKSRFVLAIASFLITVPLAAGAQELLPPQPGLSVKFRFTATHGAPQPESTFRVVAVDGFRTTAEVDRATNPPERYTLHSYRIWYSERVVQPHGTLFQESPTRLVDEFAVLKPGMVRVFPAKMRFEANPAVPTLANGQPNRSISFDLDMTYEVERAERVSVPAGEFDTFVLARTQAFSAPAGTAPAPRRDTTRIWYAPALRWWVKIENESTAPGAPKATGVAVEIRRP